MCDAYTVVFLLLGDYMAVQRALLSVFDKTGILEFARAADGAAH